MTGYGIVITKHGDRFEGRYEIVGGWVRFTGRLLHGSLYRPEVERIWPRSRVAVIRVNASHACEASQRQAVAA